MYKRQVIIVALNVTGTEFSWYLCKLVLAMNQRQKFALVRLVAINSASINDYSSDPLRGSYSFNIVWNHISEP